MLDVLSIVVESTNNNNNLFFRQLIKFDKYIFLYILYFILILKIL